MFELLDGRSATATATAPVCVCGFLQFSTDGIPFHLDDDDAIDLGGAAACSTHLKSFHLDVSGMSTAGCATLVPFLEYSKLDSIKLEGNIHTEIRARRTAQVTNRLLNAIGKNPNALMTLQLHGTHFGSGAIKSAVLGSSQIQNLVLVDCWHEATPRMIRELKEAVAENDSLRELALASLSNDLLEALLESLQDHTSVAKLRLGALTATNTESTGRAIRALIDSDVQLTDLDLCGTALTEDIIKPVVDGLIRSKTVHTFSLTVCTMGESTARCLNQLFRSSNTVLQQVSLSESINGANMLGDILTGLHRNTSVALLDISNCNFDSHLAAAHLKTLLRRNRHLTRLDIDRNSFRDAADISTICEGLESNQSLKYLDCSSCHLQDEGCSQMLQASHNLTHLIMCDNGMRLPCIQQYCERNAATVARSPLLHLILNGNDIGDAGAEQLAGLLKTGNAFLSTLYVDHCGLTGNGFAALLAGASQNSFLQHLSADCVSLAEPEDTSEAFCQAFVDSLPQFASLQSLSFSVADAHSPRPTKQQQNHVLHAFRSNTSLVKVHAGRWLFSPVQRKKHLPYFMVRNQVMPFVNDKDDDDDKEDGYWTGKKRKAPMDDNKSNNNESSKNCFPRGLWPCLLEKLLLTSAGTSVAFLALRSRPDLIVTDDTTPSPYKKWLSHRYSWKDRG